MKQLTCFGCFIEPTDPWHVYAVIKSTAKGLCELYDCTKRCEVFPKVICDGRTMQLCTKRLNELQEELR